MGNDIIIWLVVSTLLKNLKVSWDDEIPKIWKITFMFQTTNQNLFFGHMLSYGCTNYPRRSGLRRGCIQIQTHAIVLVQCGAPKR